MKNNKKQEAARIQVEQNLERVTQAFNQYQVAIDAFAWLRDNQQVAPDFDIEFEAYQFAFGYQTPEVKAAFAAVSPAEEPSLSKEEVDGIKSLDLGYDEARKAERAADEASYLAREAHVKLGKPVTATVLKGPRFGKITQIDKGGEWFIWDRVQKLWVSPRPTQRQARFYAQLLNREDGSLILKKSVL